MASADVVSRSRHPVAGTIVLVWTLLVAFMFFVGMAEVAEKTGDVGAIAVLFSLVFHFFVWVVVVGPVYLISRLFGR